MSSGDLSQLSMLDLFRLEADSQAQVLTTGLLILESDATASDQLEACMRAAHSLKGAARIVGINAGIEVAHAMEDQLADDGLFAVYRVASAGVVLLATAAVVEHVIDAVLVSF